MCNGSHLSQAGLFHKQSCLVTHRLSFITLSVRGINSLWKRWTIFRQLYNKNTSVIFLQETYSSNNQEKLWSSEWDSKIHFGHGSKHSKGVAILFNPKIQVMIENQMQSEDGRNLVLQVVIDDTKLICADIYAPNDPGAQHRFHLQLPIEGHSVHHKS